jgi:hypothetical protein
VAELSQENAQAFNLMSAEQRHEVVAVADKDELEPDEAVNSYLTQHQLALVEGELKTSEVK